MGFQLVTSLSQTSFRLPTWVVHHFRGSSETPVKMPGGSFIVDRWGGRRNLYHVDVAAWGIPEKFMDIYREHADQWILERHFQRQLQTWNSWALKLLVVHHFPFLVNRLPKGRTVEAQGTCQERAWLSGDQKASEWPRSPRWAMDGHQHCWFHWLHGSENRAPQFRRTVIMSYFFYSSRPFNI